jgi:hypothetical protein
MSKNYTEKLFMLSRPLLSSILMLEEIVYILSSFRKLTSEILNSFCKLEKCKNTIICTFTREWSDEELFV